MRVWPLIALSQALALVTLAPLASADPAPDVPADAVVGDLPFLKWPEMNRVALNLAPEGSKAFNLMLDTGASDTVLTPQYARELGVSVRRARNDRPYERETVLGRSLQFWVDTESSDTRSRTGWEYGLLGGVFLAEYVLEIDFPRRHVRFIDPDRYSVPKEVSAPNEAVLPLKIVGNRAIVEVEVEGKKVEVMLDTGAPGTMLLSGKSAERAGFTKPVLAKMVVGGVVGTTEGQLVEAEKIALGPFVFSQVPITVAPHGFYNQGPSSDSLIGYEVLSHFVMRLDYQHKRLWLRRVDEEPLTWYGLPWASARRVGLLAAVADQGISIEAVLPDTPAAKLGLQPGDQIQFHGEDDTKTKLDALLGRIERGERITVIREEEGGVLGDVELGGGAEKKL